MSVVCDEAFHEWTRLEFKEQRDAGFRLVGPAHDERVQKRLQYYFLDPSIEPSAKTEPACLWGGGELVVQIEFIEPQNHSRNFDRVVSAQFRASYILHAICVLV